MKTIAGMPVREVLGRECVLVEYGHGSCVAHLAADLHPDHYADPNAPPGACALCPAKNEDECIGTDCGGGFLVDTKWLPLLLMRLPSSNSNR